MSLPQTLPVPPLLRGPHFLLTPPCPVSLGYRNRYRLGAGPFPGAAAQPGEVVLGVWLGQYCRLLPQALPGLKGGTTGGSEKVGKRGLGVSGVQWGGENKGTLCGAPRPPPPPALGSEWPWSRDPGTEAGSLGPFISHFSPRLWRECETPEAR